MFKKIFAKKIRRKVISYLANHPDVKLVVITGSVGKSSTKRAIGSVLSEAYRVRMHDESVRTSIEVDLAMLGLSMPHNPNSLLAWIKIIRAASYQIKNPPLVDVIVQELAVDRPGMIDSYGAYLRPDIAVVSSVTDEHMDNFGSIDRVAREELSISKYSQHVFINRDDVSGRFADLELSPNFNTYGTSGVAEYSINSIAADKLHDIPAKLKLYGSDNPINIEIQIFGEHNARSLAAAAAVGHKLAVPIERIVSTVSALTPISGRMKPLKGMDGSIVIDDTCSMDVSSAISGLQAIYAYSNTPSRIVVFGTMSDPSTNTSDLFSMIGNACNPDMLSWVVFVGEPGAKYAAPIAKKHGCQVKICRDALEAAEFVRSVSEVNALVLIKGSETDMLEEAVKDLVDISEHHALVRQEPRLVTKKMQSFSRFA